MEDAIRFEIKRKFVHLLAIFYILVYVFLKAEYGHYYGLIGLILVLIFFFGVEYLRIVRRKKILIFHSVWRESEKNKIGGQIYFALGAIIVFAFLSYEVALTAMLMAIFGDFFAALTGLTIGKRQIHKNNKKKWEGFFAGLVACVIVGYLVLNNIYIAIAMAIVAMVSETFVKKVNDNLSIPVLAGAVGEVLIRSL